MADLAKLELSSEALEAMCQDLGAILDYVEALEAVPTEGVEPTTHVLDVATPLRADRVDRVLPVEDAVRNAPEHNEASFVVPKVVE